MSNVQLWLNGVSVHPTESPEDLDVLANRVAVGHHINLSNTGREYRVEAIVHHWWGDKYTMRVYIKEVR